MRLFAFLLVSFLATQTVAQTTAPKPLSAMPPNNLQLAGNWACEGTFRNKQTHKAAFTAEVILNGTWLELTERDLEPATGYVAEYLIGYDAQQKALVEFDANNFSAATYASPSAWQNNTLVLTSGTSTDPHAPYVANRFMYSLPASGTFTIDWQIQRTATSEWITADHLACKRA